MLSRESFSLLRGRIVRALTLFRFAFLVTLLSLPAVAGPKTEPAWLEKDWTHWSVIDCENVLNSSPWAESAATELGGFAVGDQIQFVSALPMRQAKTRYSRLRDSYERMNSSKKRLYDEKHPADLDEDGSRPILIRVVNTAGPNGRVGYNSLPGPFPAGQAVLRLSDGTIVMPTAITGKVVEHGNNILYTFPRIVNGKPAYVASDKSIEIFFGGALRVDKQGNVVTHDEHAFPLDNRSKVEFPIAPMIYKGKLEY